MTAKPEVKPTIAATVPTTPADTTEPKHDADAPAPLSPTAKLRFAIEKLDAERTTLVKNTIENLKPGKPFDHAVVRDINKIETRKNRLLVARFAALLKTGGPEVQAIVRQIIEI